MKRVKRFHLQKFSNSIIVLQRICKMSAPFIPYLITPNTAYEKQKRKRNNEESKVKRKNGKQTIFEYEKKRKRNIF